MYLIDFFCRFFSRQYFQHEHLYRFAFKHGQEDTTIQISAPVETPMPVFPLIAGVESPSPLVEWVEGSAFWDGLVRGMYAIDTAYVNGRRGTLEGIKCCMGAMKWGNFLLGALCDENGPYQHIEKQMLDTARTEVSAVLSWIEHGAEEDSDAPPPSNETETEPPAPVEGEEPPPPVFVKLAGVKMGS